MMDRPINIVLEEVKEEVNVFIDNLLKKHNLNFYLLQIIIKELYENVSFLKEQELEETKKSLEESKEEK